MSPVDFIDNELRGYIKQSEIQQLIFSIIDLPHFTLEFNDSDFYGTDWIGWGARIHFSAVNKIDGALVHELLHANLYKRKFPYCEEYYVNNENVFFKELLDEATNRDLFNVLGHRIFFDTYIDLGFAKEDFVDINYKDGIINSGEFSNLCCNFNITNLQYVKEYISRYFEIYCDMDDSRTEVNRS
jgi:hypothetical protein